MGLLILSALVLIGTQALFFRAEYLVDEKKIKSKFWEFLYYCEYAPTFITMISGFVLVASIFIVVSTYITEDAFMAKMKEKEALIEQRAEIGICAYDKCILDEIADYNTSVLTGKVYVSNPFLYGLYHRGYKKLEPISYDIVNEDAHKEHIHQVVIEKSDN